METKIFLKTGLDTHDPKKPIEANQWVHLREPRGEKTAATYSTVIPGMNAIAFTREVRAIFGAPRRMVFSAVRAAILRGAQESTRTSSGNGEAVAQG